MKTAGGILILSACVLGVCALGAGGCSRHAVGIPRNDDAREVSLAEFAQPMAHDPLGSAGRSSRAADVAASDGPIVWFDELEQREVLRPARPGDVVIVDSLVGHINGRPMFADEFLQPIEDRLLRAAEQTRGPELDEVFLNIIEDWLQEVVFNELILAEAEASLSEQEQMGLFAMLNNVYDEEIRKGRGTKSGAETRRRREGDELNQYVGKQKDIVLIRHLRDAKIRSRVVVTWRDIEREYARSYEDFNPASTVTLARIRLQTAAQAQLIEDVTARIEAGEAFLQIAEDLDVYNGGLLEPFDMGPAGITDIDVRDVSKDALKGLTEGDTTRPYRIGGNTLWLHVVSVDRPESLSIYEPRIQNGLRNALHARRSQIEWNRYIQSLLEDGVHDDIEAMSDRLFEIAVMRYGR